MIGFSTAHSVRYDEEQVQQLEVMPEGKIDLAFRAMAGCAEETVLDSMYCAEAMTGFEGHHVACLREFL